MEAKDFIYNATNATSPPIEFEHEHKWKRVNKRKIIVEKCDCGLFRTHIFEPTH